ncbi:AAA family ATPase [Arthrobacter bambusae]|uniref:AAA family ATPase n=1 Tax=Arthrobacter bambusae TaxID=1338426 RepID=UPI00278272FD|nr:AAA family ATPase [Arthrobacter bambusae]MDQ0030167.1 ABC-type cobalamin/Fe3+-siderophores transport system ATPase subunit [Arthrobacter bambusae]MDQ0097849.1 ABC-type cobalamin/Fe3+-siderophores transport system ATPase subunit [Arthrobacter bambusae]
MSAQQFRHDDLLASLGLARGSAENLRVTIDSVRLTSGSVIEFEAQGVTAIAGGNNCGKSTLLTQIAAKLTQPNGELVPSLVEELRPSVSGSHSDFLDWLCEHAVLTPNPQNPPLSSFLRMGASIALSEFQYWINTGGTQHLDLQRAAYFFVRQMGAGERNVAGAGRKSNVLEGPSHPMHYLAESSELMDELNRLTQKILGIVLSLDDLNQVIQLRVGATDVPYPARFGDPSEYQSTLDRLPRLEDQGDGIRSLLGILIPLITATYPIFIIDEPEAFLHPPQAFALGQELGRIAKEKGVQVILATHDRNLLAGLLNSSSPLSVVRMVRTDDSTVAHQLRSSDLKKVWDDPVLKYSNVLDGLFHQLVVLAENERDCRFYEAALDVYSPTADDTVPKRTLPATDVLFVPTSGTGGMPKVARALRALQVPVLACPDLDVLDSESVVKNIVTALGSEWDGLHDDWVAVTAPLNSADTSQLVSEVFRDVSKEIQRILQDDPMAKYEEENRRRIREALGASLRPWEEVKKYGLDALTRLCGNPEAVNRLVTGLAERRLVVVHEGELESFGHRLGVKKGKAWLPAALRTDLQSSPEVQAHISRILKAAEPILD